MLKNINPGILMNSFISYDKMDLKWFMLHIKGSKVIISKLRCTSVPKNYIFLVYSVYPNEMPHFVAFYLGVHCLPIVLFGDLEYTKDK